MAVADPVWGLPSLQHTIVIVTEQSSSLHNIHPMTAMQQPLQRLFLTTFDSCHAVQPSTL